MDCRTQTNQGDLDIFSRASLQYHEFPICLRKPGHQYPNPLHLIIYHSTDRWQFIEVLDEASENKFRNFWLNSTRRQPMTISSRTGKFSLNFPSTSEVPEHLHSPSYISYSAYHSTNFYTSRWLFSTKINKTSDSLHQERSLLFIETLVTADLISDKISLQIAPFLIYSIIRGVRWWGFYRSNTI